MLINVFLCNIQRINIYKRDLVNLCIGVLPEKFKKTLLAIIMVFKQLGFTEKHDQCT